ncbi:MAG: ABC transporter substrate-binding protein [Sphingobacteriaceae bacterium]|nr:ABC transporter substrate-binding protein [Sphingobacteriaceae bacterium]
MRIFGLFLVSTISIMVITACGGDQDKGSNERLSGNKVLRIAEVNAPISIFPHKLTNNVEALIASQIHEGLVKINPKDLSIMPGIAEKWEIGPDGKTITFFLRKDAQFQEDEKVKGSNYKVTSKDVKFTFELLCTNRKDNYHFQTVCKDRLVGANDYYVNSDKAEKNEIKGLKIIDDYTFSVELLNSPQIFLQILANPVASIINKKVYDRRKDSLNTGLGPFIYDYKASNKKRHVLYRNKNYYAKNAKGESLPLIDSLIIDVVASSEEALQGFKSEKFDLITSVPSNQLKSLVEENIGDFKGKSPRYIIEQKPEMLSSFYAFNVNKEPFNNLKLRQAFNYAIDRNRIIEKVLFGQAHGPAENGIVPPSFSYYPSHTIKGYTFDVEKAKALLKEAGYPEGKGLPEIQLLVNSGNSINNSVAVEIQKQLKNNINVNIGFESIPISEKFYLEVKGKAEMFREGWVADYPSPESFLSVFYGEPVTNDTSQMAFPNTTKYKNLEFDRYYKMGRDAVNTDSATKYFLIAEQILIDDAPLIPLWYDSNCRLINFRIKNFYTNALRFYDFTQVDIVDEPKQ